MSKKSDDSIERIFRQALTQYDTKFQETDWLKMEKLLNEEAGRKAAARSKTIKRTAYTLTGLTGLIIAVYFLAINNPSDSIARLNDSVTEMRASEDLTKNGNVKHENLSESLLSESSASKSKEQQEKLKEEDRKDNAALLHGDKSITPRSTQPPIPNRASPDATPHPVVGDETKQPENEPVSGGAAAKQSTRQELKGEQRKLTPDASSEQLTNQSPVAIIAPRSEGKKKGVNQELAISDDATTTSGGESAGDPKELNELEDNGSISSGSTLTSTSTYSKQGITAQDSSLQKNTAALNQENSMTSTATPDQQAGKPKPSSRLSIAFVFAPEFSTTSLSQYSSPGESFGLLIGYRLSNRFSINTGVIRSTKKYEGEGYSYTPRNPAYWRNRTNGVVPEEIYSRCLVYELPVGVQFDAITTPKSRVFLSTGISSYFMVSQAYDYTFDAPNPGADMGWRSPGSESYWFSIGMVSAGYERYIHRSFAIGIEPYLKISLSEIGWPNIKLFSTGAYVTLRYKFMSRRNFN